MIVPLLDKMDRQAAGRRLAQQAPDFREGGFGGGQRVLGIERQHDASFDGGRQDRVNARVDHRMPVAHADQALIDAVRRQRLLQQAGLLLRVVENRRFAADEPVKVLHDRRPLARDGGGDPVADPLPDRIVDDAGIAE